MPSVPPAAIVPVASEREYLYLLSSGSATWPMVEAVAVDEPQTAPKPAQAAIAAIATPPRKRPSHAFAARNRSDDSPQRDASPPIRMNIGSTDRS